MNFKIFPATYNHEGQKVPLFKGWREKASNDPVQIKQWQEFYRDRIQLWGAPCGPMNGIMVLDVDLKHDQNGMKTIQENNLLLPETMWQKTPSGGYHFFFKFDHSRDPGNKVKFLHGLDVRSTDGWAAIYGLENTHLLADMPDWIWQACTKKDKEKSPTASLVQVSPEIGMEIFNEAIDAIKNAPPGESNNTLNIQSYLVGQLVAAGGVDRTYAQFELFKAAKERGKPDYEAQATITSGIEGGIKNPRTYELPKAAPVPVIPMVQSTPEVPGVHDRWTPRFFMKSELFNFQNLRKPQLFEDWSTEDIHLMSADGGTGKTTLKLYEAVCLALNAPFLGFQCLSPGRTLFITGEDSAAKLGAMLGAILRQMKLTDNTPENNAKVEQVLSSIVIKKDADLCLIAKDKQGFLTVNRDAMNKVMEAVEDLKPRMIIWDPIASFWGSESAVNDMNKAVAKFMGELQERSGACVEMINHIGKQSSSQKDMTQFAGRGGTGLPSHARVVRTLFPLSPDEYKSKTGMDLPEGKSAMVCNIGKFTDGSPLYNKPFIILREGYLFERQVLAPEKQKELQDIQIVIEIIMMAIKQEIKNGNVVTVQGISAKVKSDHGYNVTKIREAFSLLKMQGLYGDRIKEVVSDDPTVKEKILIVTNEAGEELDL